MEHGGIDVHAKSGEIAVLDEVGDVSEESRIPTTESSLRRWFGNRPPMVICLEAGGQSAWAERILRDRGHDVVVANPTRVRLIAEATLKNDHVDAVTLVRLVRADRKLLCPIVHRSAETQRQRGILRSRRALVNARTSCLNAARDRLLQAAPASGCSGKDRVTSSATRGTAHPQPTQVAKTGPRLPAHPDA